MTQIELEMLTRGRVRVLIGQEKGLAARKALKLDELDGGKEQVTVVAPEGLRTITPSFVQGLFAASVHRLGEERFFEHYRFVASPRIVSDIKAGVDRVLTSRHISGAR